MLFPWERENYIKRKNQFNLIRDIERCPYVPSEAEYEQWVAKDEERLNKIAEEREKMVKSAKVFLNQGYASRDELRSFAEFIVFLFER